MFVVLTTSLPPNTGKAKWYRLTPQKTTGGWINPAPRVFTRPSAGLAFYFAIAVAAIDRFAIARFERNLCGFTAVRASGGEHLACSVAAAAIAAAAVAIATITAGAGPAFCFPGIATRWAAFRLIGITLGLEKFLVLNTERERGSAIGTLKWFVLKTHLDDLLSLITS